MLAGLFVTSLGTGEPAGGDGRDRLRPKIRAATAKVSDPAATAQARPTDARSRGSGRSSWRRHDRRELPEAARRPGRGGAGRMDLEEDGFGLALVRRGQELRRDLEVVDRGRQPRPPGLRGRRRGAADHPAPGGRLAGLPEPVAAGLEHPGDLGHRPRAVLRAFGQHQSVHRVERLRDLRPRGPQGRGRLVAVGEQPPEDRVAAERRPADQQGVQGAAQPIDVGAVVGGPRVLRLLGGHVVGGAHEHPGMREPGVVAGAGARGRRRRLVEHAGQAEVEDADDPPGVDHEVARLDVPVDDPPRMGRVEPAGGLGQEVEGLADRQGADVLEELLQVAAAEVFHDQEVDAAVLVGVDHADEVGVVHQGRGLRLAAEPLDRRAVAAEGRGQDLDGDLAAERAVPGLEDDPHPPRADPLEDQVVADDQAVGLALEDRPGLIRRDGAAGEQGPRQVGHAPGGLGHDPVQLIAADQPELQDDPGELGGADGPDGHLDGRRRLVDRLVIDGQDRPRPLGRRGRRARVLVVSGSVRHGEPPPWGLGASGQAQVTAAVPAGQAGPERLRGRGRPGDSGKMVGRFPGICAW